MKNTIKSSVESLTNKMDQGEHKIFELEDKVEEQEQIQEGQR